MSQVGRFPSPRRATRSRVHTAFTLVELLVVITIIGVLTALLIVGVGAATRAARRATISVEIQQMSQALEQYASKHASSYPPDFASTGSDSTWSAPLAKQYNRFKLSVHGSDFRAVHIQAGLDPSEALVFWLGGYSNINTSGTPLFPSIPRKLLGFKPSPTKPFITIVTGAASEIDPAKPANLNFTRPDWAFDFKEDRLVDSDSDGFYEYLPPAGKTPYVYFCRSSYSTGFHTTTFWGTVGSESGLAVPYFVAEPANTPPVKLDAASNWVPVAADKYQIICAGLDNDFGSTVATSPRTFPDAANYMKADEDNITSFSEGKSLGDLKPEG